MSTQVTAANLKDDLCAVADSAFDREQHEIAEQAFRETSEDIRESVRRLRREYREAQDRWDRDWAAWVPGTRLPADPQDKFWVRLDEIPNPNGSRWSEVAHDLLAPVAEALNRRIESASEYEELREKLSEAAKGEAFTVFTLSDDTEIETFNCYWGESADLARSIDLADRSDYYCATCAIGLDHSATCAEAGMLVPAVDGEIFTFEDVRQLIADFAELAAEQMEEEEEM